MKIQIAPSILSADFGRLGAEIALVEPYVDRIHFDVMDGHFVPNISFGAPILRYVKTKLPVDVHLMIENPWLFFEDFVKAIVERGPGTGAGVLIVHEEACPELEPSARREGVGKRGSSSAGPSEAELKKVLRKIREFGVGVGISIKPKTAVARIKGVLDMVDQVLVMTVEPGFGGQKFMEEMMTKILELREMGFSGDIAVDGGINAETAAMCVNAGANILVAGNYIFGAGDDEAKIRAVKSLR